MAVSSDVEARLEEAVFESVVVRSLSVLPSDAVSSPSFAAVFFFLASMSSSSSPSSSLRSDHVSVELREVGGGDVLAVGPEEGVQVLSEEEVGAVLVGRH